MSNKHRTVSLVLGSGGARGMCHIGVIRWLEENEFQIESIAGCSAGALVGGIYAAEKLADFEEWVKGINKLDIVKLLDLSWEGAGLIKGDKVFNQLIDLVGDKQINELRCAFTAVASDINREKEVWLNTGSLFDAIRASMALPLLFTPYKIKDTALIDGGVLNPVPIAPTFSDDTDITIAVNLGGKVKESSNKQEKIAKPKELVEDESSDMSKKINGYIEKLKTSIKPPKKFDWGVYDVANQAFDAMQSTIAREKLASYPPDCLIEIPRNACGTLEVYRAEEMIELGYKTAQEKLSELLDK